MSGGRLRPISVGPVDVEIDAPDAASVRLGALVGAFPDAVGGPARQVIRVVVIASADHVEARGGRYDLAIDGDTPISDAPLWRVEDTIFHRMNRWFVATDLEHVHLHSAAVSRDGRAVLLAGPSGLGKSTLTSHLVRRGWAYLTDETVAVTDSGDLRAYPRPLTLKPGSWDLFAGLPSVASTLRAKPGDGDGRVRVHLPPAELGAAPTPIDPLPVGLVVVLAGEVPADGADLGGPDVELLGTEQVVKHLVANSMDLGRMGVTGMRALMQLAGSAKGIRITRGDLDATVAVIDAALAEGPVEVELEELPAVAGPEPHRSATAHTWVLDGDGAVVYREDPGEVLELDRHAVSVWRQLDGGRSIEEIAAGLAAGTGASPEVVERDVRALVGDLGRRGLLSAVS